MEAMASDALQRAGLASLVDAFHTVCKYSNIWSVTAVEPPPNWNGEHGSWRGQKNDSGARTLVLQFKNPTLGTFTLVDKGTHMDSWAWTVGERIEPRYTRLPHDLKSEAALGSPPGPLPLDIFEQLWVALHGACREYVRGNELKPSGFSAILFSRL